MNAHFSCSLHCQPSINTQRHRVPRGTTKQASTKTTLDNEQL